MSRVSDPQATLFCDLPLARRLERAEAAANAGFVESRARLYPESGACWIDVGGTYAMFDTPASPSTQTFGLGLFEPVRDVDLDRIEAFFRERGAGVFQELSSCAPPALLPLLHARGYAPEQIGRLVDQTPRGVRALLDEAGRRLGAANTTAAVREARRRGLIT